MLLAVLLTPWSQIRWSRGHPGGHGDGHWRRRPLHHCIQVASHLDIPTSPTHLSFLRCHAAQYTRDTQIAGISSLDSLKGIIAEQVGRKSGVSKGKVLATVYELSPLSPGYHRREARCTCTTLMPTSGEAMGSSEHRKPCLSNP